MKVKICGMMCRQDISAVNDAMPDYVGFIFAPSRRRITAGQAMLFREQLKDRIQAVGVFVDASPSEIIAIANAGIIDLIQLHGQERQKEISYLKENTRCKIIKAVSVKTVEDLREAEKIQADYLLFDQGSGGSGIPFSWDLLDRWENTKRKAQNAIPYFLAGGVNPENLSSAIAAGNPFGIDLSSGVETDGRKDPRKILEVIRRIRNE